MALFPSDVRATAGWLHIAVGDESLASIATWFTGRPDLAEALAAENGLGGDSWQRGRRSGCRRSSSSARSATPRRSTSPSRRSSSTARTRRDATRCTGSGGRRPSTPRSSSGSRDASTRRTSSSWRGTIAKRSGIEDVHAIPVGYPVKIPLDVLAEEFLPKDDPRARARALEKAETAQFSLPARARGLRGVRIVLDAGHGGRDTGTIHGGVWEATYVYDVAVRLRKILSEKTQAEVVMTTKDTRLGWKVAEQDVLAPRRSQVLLTDPPYELDDPVLGVNLRWYLANSLLKRPGAGEEADPARADGLRLDPRGLAPPVAPRRDDLRARGALPAGPVRQAGRLVRGVPRVARAAGRRVQPEGADRVGRGLDVARRKARRRDAEAGTGRPPVLAGPDARDPLGAGVGAGRPPVQPDPEPRPRRDREPRQRGGPRLSSPRSGSARRSRRPSPRGSSSSSEASSSPPRRLRRAAAVASKEAYGARRAVGLHRPLAAAARREGSAREEAGRQEAGARSRLKKAKPKPAAPGLSLPPPRVSARPKRTTAAEAVFPPPMVSPVQSAEATPGEHGDEEREARRRGDAEDLDRARPEPEGENEGK